MISGDGEEGQPGDGMSEGRSVFAGGADDEERFIIALIQPKQGKDHPGYTLAEGETGP